MDAEHLELLAKNIQTNAAAIDLQAELASPSQVQPAP